MPYTVKTTKEGLVLSLSGELTVRRARELGQCLSEAFSSGMAAVVEASQVEDIDTSILQLILSLGRTASEFSIRSPSEAFVKAADRCALRRELLIEGKGEVL